MVIIGTILDTAFISYYGNLLLWLNHKCSVTYYVVLFIILFCNAFIIVVAIFAFTFCTLLSRELQPSVRGGRCNGLHISTSHITIAVIEYLYKHIQ